MNAAQPSSVRGAEQVPEKRVLPQVHLNVLFVEALGGGAIDHQVLHAVRRGGHGAHHAAHAVVHALRIQPQPQV